LDNSISSAIQPNNYNYYIKLLVQRANIFRIGLSILIHNDCWVFFLWAVVGVRPQWNHRTSHTVTFGYQSCN